MSGVQNLAVDADEADMRLDRWFKRRFPHVPHARVERMCRKGEIRIDGGRVRPATRLEPGQTVRVPPLPPAAPRAEQPAVDARAAAEIQARVIYRDAEVLVLDKPPGLPVQGGTGQTRHLDALAPALQFEAEAPPRLVHRLDKDTSGVLVLGRTAWAAAELATQFRSRETRKMYWAAVAGVPAPAMGTIRYGLVKAPGHGSRGEGEKMHCVHPDAVGGTDGAKRAVTDYAVIEAAAKRAAWVALVPVTGRTHQLRAHMAEIGSPIVGDGKYGGRGQTNEGDGWGARLGGAVSAKLHLHARSLAIAHPRTGATLHLTAPLPPHMARTWELFGWDADAAPEDPFQE